MGRPRFDLSGSQVVASLLAAMTGAVAASYLGIAGTIIGAAVMSVASTAGAAVYKHYLARSRERLKAAAVVIAPRATLTVTAGHRGHRSAAEPATGDSAQTEALARTEDPAQTEAMLARTEDSARTVPSSGRLASSSIADEAETEVFARVGNPGRAQHADLPAGQVPDRGSRPAENPAEMPDGNHAGGTADQEHRPGQPDGRPGRLRRWAPLAAVALAVFLFVMGGITAVELVAGRPLDSVLHGQRGSGTSVGQLIGGNHAGRPDSPARPKPSHPAPSVQPSPSPSPSRLPSPSPSPSPSRSPSPSPSSPSASSAPSPPA